MGLDDPIFEEIREKIRQNQEQQVDPMTALMEAKRELEEFRPDPAEIVVSIEVNDVMYEYIRFRFSKGALEMPQFWMIPVYRNPNIEGMRINCQDGHSVDKGPNSDFWDDE